MSSPTSNVYQLPLATRTCIDCVHFETRMDEEEEACFSYCVEWDEPLDDESIAESCEDFELVPEYKAPSRHPSHQGRRTV